jgi:hypothetical protein
MGDEDAELSSPVTGRDANRGASRVVYVSETSDAKLRLKRTIARALVRAFVSAPFALAVVMMFLDHLASQRATGYGGPQRPIARRLRQPVRAGAGH